VLSLHIAGVTAYNGDVPLITNKDYLGAHAGILAVEGYHAGAIRSRLTTIESQLLAPYLIKVSAVVEAVSNLRAKVGGGKDQGILPPASYSQSARDDSVPRTNAYARNTTEVLSIVYLGGSNQGGFFPNGFNGKLWSTQLLPACAAVSQGLSTEPYAFRKSVALSAHTAQYMLCTCLQASTIKLARFVAVEPIAYSG
jgi:hypothetical protein